MIPAGDPTPEAAREQRRRDHAYRARMWRWILALDLGFWLIIISIAFPPAPRLVWNASASAPIGLYWVSPGAPVIKSDTVIAWTPGPARELAAARRYIPMNVPLVKRVAAAEGDRVCAIGSAILVNGHKVARRRSVDGQGRPMPWWSGCRTLGEREYFLLMPHVATSFDGRYFGVTERADIIGSAKLVWAR
jgi:conjugative transfer signal peptidase TraF